MDLELLEAAPKDALELGRSGADRFMRLRGELFYSGACLMIQKLSDLLPCLRTVGLRAVHEFPYEAQYFLGNERRHHHEEAVLRLRWSA